MKMPDPYAEPALNLGRQRFGLIDIGRIVIDMGMKIVDVGHCQIMGMADAVSSQSPLAHSFKRAISNPSIHIGSAAR